MKVNSTIHYLSQFFVLILFAFSTQNAYGIVNDNQSNILNQTNTIETIKEENKKQERKIKKLKKKLAKYHQKKEKSNKYASGLLIFGLLFLILGIAFIALSFTYGSGGVYLLLSAISLSLSGIVLLLVHGTIKLILKNYLPSNNPPQNS